MSHPGRGAGSRVEWVATPPGDQPRPTRPRTAARYTGPPSYPAVPRWGFPALTWRWPLTLPTKDRVDPVERVSSLGATAVSMLWITAFVAGGAGLAEGWRYLLLLRSRGEALPKTMLAISDALVTTTGVLTWLLGMLCGLTVLLWALRARVAAAERIGVQPGRPDWQVVAGLLVPGVNLLVPGSALAELEHKVLAGEQARRPRGRPDPSPLLRWWWLAWIVSLLLGWTAFGWGFRDSVQATADGVVLHMWNDFAVVGLVVLTIRVVRYLTALLVPADPIELPLLRVLGIRDAPAPARQRRPSDAAR